MNCATAHRFQITNYSLILKSYRRRSPCGSFLAFYGRKTVKSRFCYILRGDFTSLSLFFHILAVWVRNFASFTNSTFFDLFLRLFSLFSTVLSENSVSAVVKHPSLLVGELVYIPALLHRCPRSVRNGRIVRGRNYFRGVHTGCCGGISIITVGIDVYVFLILHN